MYLFSAVEETGCCYFYQILNLGNLSSDSVIILTLLKDYEQGNSRNSSKHFPDNLSDLSSPKSLPIPKQLKFTPGIANVSGRESAAFLDQTRKVIFLQRNLFLIVVLSSCLISTSNIGCGCKLADGSSWTVVNEEISNCRTTKR